MAVVINVYGKADLAQIHKAEKQLAGMKREVASQSGTWSKWGASMKGAFNVGAAALAGASLIVAKSISTYQAYGKEIKTVMRLTGATSQVASTLTGQWRLSGVAAEKGAACMKFLSKAMYAARSEGSAQAKVFTTLGIRLKDSNGRWIDSAKIIAQVRDKMAGMKDATARTALAVQLFGKGGAELLPWLTKSNAEIDKQTKLLTSLGLVWTAQDMKKWGDLAQAQRTLSITMTALQIRIAEVAVPLLTKLLPGLTSLAGVLVKIPTPVYQAAAGFLALFVAMSGIMKVKGILEGFGILKGLSGVPAVLGRVAGGFRSAQVAESAFSGAAGTLGGRLRGLTTLLAGLPAKIAANVVAIGPYILAIAALTAAVYLTVKAFNEMRAAQKFLEKQTAEANSNQLAQLARIKAKYGENSEEYRKFAAAVKAADDKMLADKKAQATGWLGWVQSLLAGQHSLFGNWSPAGALAGVLQHAPGFGGAQAAGGDYMVKRPTWFLAGEAGPERATFTPHGKTPPGGGKVVHLHLHIGNFIGTDAAAARQLGNLVKPYLDREDFGLASTGF